MTGSYSWVAENWSAAVGAVGIIGSLWMAILAAHREAKAREIENLLTISDHHRELWNAIQQKPGLSRILKSDVDISAAPVTTAEEEFVNLVMVHFLTTWRLARSGGIIAEGELMADVRGFFSLPLPQVVWEKTRQFRNPKFVRFVERALNRHARL